MAQVRAEIDAILNRADEGFLKIVHSMLTAYAVQTNIGKLIPLKDNQQDILAVARQPMPEKIDIEVLKKEQNYSTAALRLHYQQKDMSLWEGEDVFELLELLD